MVFSCEQQVNAELKQTKKNYNGEGPNTSGLCLCVV